MALDDADRLRQMLGESLTSGQVPEDTLFTEREIDDFLLRSGTAGLVGEALLNGAAYHGWVAKAGIYANMADVQEGTSREALSKLSDHAENRLKYFGTISGLMPGSGRSVRQSQATRR